jgi:DNA-binding transcriptional regulator YiaG
MKPPQAKIEIKNRLANACQTIETSETKRRAGRTKLQQEFSLSLRVLRKNRGQTLDELSDVFGVTIAMVSHMEMGRKLPSAETAAKIRAWAEGGG